jgi:GT2 family glycosyltransferase
MIDLSIIIVSYNTKAFLEKCLTAIELNKPQRFSYEAIVVDNNSKDESAEMVKKDFPKITLIENKENMGFSKANNIGIKKSKGRYVLFLNSDTEIEKETLDIMISFMENQKNAGAATCKVVMPNGKIDDASHRGFPTPWNAFC